MAEGMRLLQPTRAFVGSTPGIQEAGSDYVNPFSAKHRITSNPPSAPCQTGTGGEPGFSHPFCPTPGPRAARGSRRKARSQRSYSKPGLGRIRGLPLTPQIRSDVIWGVQVVVVGPRDAGGCESLEQNRASQESPTCSLSPQGNARPLGVEGMSWTRRTQPRAWSIH